MVGISQTSNSGMHRSPCVEGNMYLGPIDEAASLAVEAGGLNSVDADGLAFAPDGLWAVARGECLSACVARAAAGFALFAGGVSDFPRSRIFFASSRRFLSRSRFAAFCSSAFNLGKA